MIYELETPQPFLALPLTSERAVCRLGQVFKGAQFLKACFEGGFDDCKRVAAGYELLWWIVHPGDLHQDVAELGGITLLGRRDSLTT